MGPATKHIVALTLLIGLVLLLSAVTWHRYLGEDWQTGPRRVEWPAAPGSGESDSDETLGTYCGGESRFRALVWGESMWTSCHAPWAGLARIDLASKRVVVYPFPTEFPPSWSIAIAPGTEGRLGHVYRGSGASTVVVGLAGQDGWIQPPRRLPGDSGVRVLGVGWTETGLDIVASRAWPIRYCAVFHYGLDGSVLRRKVDVERLCPGGETGCHVHFAYRRKGSAEWHFVVKDKAGVFDVTEGGQRVSSALSSPVMQGVFLDRTVAGVLIENPAGIRSKLTAEGTEAGIPARPAKADSASRWGGHYHVVDSELRLSDRWYLGSGFAMSDGPQKAVVRQQKGPDGVGHTALDDTSDPDNLSTHLVARTPGSCTELSQGILVPRAEGFWLASPTGCYVAVDEHFDRTDPLGVGEHVRRHGSAGMERDEPHCLVYLVWLLFGLPLCLFVGLGFGWWRGRKRPDPKLSLVGGATVGVLVFLISALYPFFVLLEVLR